MSKLIAVLVASLFATAAFAQQNTPGVPPVQPAAGTPDSTGKAGPMTTSPMASDSAIVGKKAARAAKLEGPQAKRDAKVGDKPLN